MDKTQSQYSYKNSKGVVYYLNTKEITLRGGRKQSIYYFSKDAGRAEACGMPEGKVVSENPRNGFLALKKA